ncbi:hypothetical protein D3C86_2219690 [compost metagenome]
MYCWPKARIFSWFSSDVSVFCNVACAALKALSAARMLFAASAFTLFTRLVEAVFARVIACCPRSILSFDLSAIYP